MSRVHLSEQDLEFLYSRREKDSEKTSILFHGEIETKTTQVKTVQKMFDKKFQIKEEGEEGVTGNKSLDTGPG